MTGGISRSPETVGWDVGAQRRVPPSRERWDSRLRRYVPPYAVLMVALLGLGACTSTRFESPLGDQLDTCDPRWQGLWVEREDDGEDGEAAIQVDAQCRLFVLDQADKGGPVKAAHVPVNFAKVGGKEYLVVSDKAVLPVFEPGPVFGVKEQPEKTFYFVRYRVRGDRIELYDVDDERVAHLIVDDEVEGTISKTDNEMHNYVRGDRSRMVEIVRKHDLFERKPSVLVRSPMTLEEYERALIERQRKEAASG